MKIISPSVPDELTSVEKEVSHLLYADETVRELHFTHGEASGLRAKALTLNESLIETTDLSQSTIESFSTRDCLFRDCDLTACSFASSGWHAVEVAGSRCSGIQLQSSTLKNVRFKGCKLDMANFRFAQLTNVIFEDCIITEMDFYNAKLKDVVFSGCDIEDVEFSGATLKNVDLTESYIVSLKGVQSLKGASLTHPQLISLAPYFADALGITIKN